MKITVCDYCLAESMDGATPTLNVAVWRKGTKGDKVDACELHKDNAPPRLKPEQYNIPGMGNLTLEYLHLGATAHGKYSTYFNGLIRASKATKGGRK